MRAIAEWVADQDAQILAMMGLTGSRAPSEPTIRRVLTAVDADVLDLVLGAWMWTRTHTGPDGRRVIALDGKTVRGARHHHLPQGAAGTVAPHLVSAYDHDTDTVLGQLAVAAKAGRPGPPGHQRATRPTGWHGASAADRAQQRRRHQTPILTSRTDLTAAEVAWRMSARWRQENYFKYAREHFALDAPRTSRAARSAPHLE